MLKLVLLTTLLLGLSACSSMQVQPVKNPSYKVSQDFSPKKYQSMVRLEFKDYFFCSGTVISDDYILTAAHCLRNEEGKLTAQKIKVKSIANADGEIGEVEAKAFAGNGSADYALVKGDFREFTKAPIMMNQERKVFDLRKGHEILVCGFPRGASGVCYPTGNEIKFDDFGFMLVGVLYPGMSGGPVVDLTTNEIIAVNSKIGTTADIIYVMPLIGIFETLKVDVVK